MRLHSPEGLEDGRFDFAQVFKNNNWSENKINSSNARADSLGIDGVKRHIKYLLENAHDYGIRYIITEGIDQINLGIELAKPVQDSILLNLGEKANLDDLYQTTGSTELLQLKNDSGNAP
jgi:hypothetical protein